MQCGEGLSAATPRPVLEPHDLASFCRPRHRAAFICLGVVPLDCFNFTRLSVLFLLTIYTKISVLFYLFYTCNRVF
ncbi:hypothetical protein HMPREF0239_04971 [Clostridium sp. ATCC BAA-442]|nr:hypothetical protein HMPREF0239_04971 [Clostridium sp. ATCC BAA-442]